MIEKRFSLAIVILISIIMGTLIPAQAANEDILSHFQFYITAQEEYNSNIDLSPNRFKRDDFITTISPGIRFSTTTKSPLTGEFRRTITAEERHGADLDFRAGFIFYSKEKDNNFTSLDGTLNAWYGFTKNLTFRVRDYLIRSDEIREADFSATALPGQTLVARTNRREPYLRNVFEPSLEYRFGEGNVASLNYRNMVYRNRSSLSENSEENVINPRITYRFDVRHSVSLDYSLSMGEFERSPDLITHLAIGRYTYRFNPRTSIFADYSFEIRDFDSSTVGVSSSVDYRIHRPSIGIEHSLSPTVSGRVQGGYFWQIPRIGATLKGFYYDLGLTKRAERTSYVLSFAGGYAEDFFTAENRGFTKYHRLLVTISHQLGQHFSVGGSTSYERAKSEPDAKDRIWGIGVNCSYRIFRWLTASLDFSHRENHAKFEDRDYSEYRGVFIITATY